MAGKNITGIFLAVEIDKQRTMDGVRDLLNSVRSTLSSSNAGNLSLDINEKAFTDKVSKAAAHLEAFKKLLGKQTEISALSDVIAETDKASDSMARLASRMTEVSYLQSVGNAFHNIARAMGVSGNEAVALARELGATGRVLDYITERWTRYSNSASRASQSERAAAAALRESQRAMQVVAGIRTTSVNVAGTAEARAALSELAAASGMSEARIRALSSVLMRNDAANTAASSYIRIANALNLTGDAAVRYASRLGVTGQALQIVTQHFTAAERRARGFGEAIRNLVTTTSAVNALQSSLAVLGANLSIAGLVELGKSAIDVSIKVDSLRVAYESIYKTGFRAAAQLDYIRKVSKDLGLEFYSTAKGAKSFFAAMQTSKIAGDANAIFKALSGASAALKLTSDETNRVFLAVGQMVSKGKIQAEELRTQLGEVLPGAVQTLATAMGKSLPELDKMLERGEVGIENLKKFAAVLETEYGESAVNAANSLLGELNKLKTAWTDFKAALWKSDTATTLFSYLRSALEFLTKNIDIAKAALKAFFTAASTYAVVSALAKSVAALSTGMSTLGTVIHRTTFSLAGFRAAVTSLMGSLGPVAFALSILAGTYSAISSYADIAQSSAAQAGELSSAIGQEASEYEKLTGAVKNATDAMEEFRQKRAKEALRDKEAELQKYRQDFTELLSNFRTGFGKLEFNFFGSKSQLDGLDEYNSKLYNVSDRLVDLERAYNDGKLSAIDYKSAVKDIADELKAAGPKFDNIVELISGFANTALNARIKIAELIPVLKAAANGVAELSKAAAGGFELNLGDTRDIQRRMALLGKSATQTALINSYYSLTKNVKDVKKEDAISFAKDAEKIFATKGKEAGAAFAKSALEKIGVSVPIDQVNALGDLLAVTYAEAASKASKSTVSATKKASDVIGELTKKVATLRAELAGDKGSRFLASADEDIRKFEEKIKELTGKVPSAATGQIKALLDEYKKLKIDQALALESKEYTKQLEEYSKFSRRVSKEFLKTSGADGEVNILVAKEKMDNDLKQLEQFYNQALEKRRQYEEKIKEFEASGDTANAEKLRKQLEEQLITEEQYESDKAKIKAVYEDQALRNSENIFDQMKVMAQDYFKTYGNLAKGVSGVMKNAADSMGNAIGDFVAKGMRDFNSLADAFSSMVDSMISEIGRLLAKQAVSGLFKLVGGFFGGSDGGSTTTKSSATGNVFSGGNLSAYSGSVVSRPTAFNYGTHLSRYARGAGLMGEAGPEAILPLTRDSRGRLGVTAQTDSGNTPAVVNNVNIINYSGENVEQRQSDNSTGGVDYEVIIGNVAARQISTPGTRANRAVLTQTNSSRPAIRR